MKITKRHLRRLIREEKASLLKEQPAGTQTFRVNMLVAVASGAEEYILNSIEDGMEFNEEAGEGILEYDIKLEAPEPEREFITLRDPSQNRPR